MKNSTEKIFIWNYLYNCKTMYDYEDLISRFYDHILKNNNIKNDASVKVNIYDPHISKINKEISFINKQKGDTIINVKNSLLTKKNNEEKTLVAKKIFKCLNVSAFALSPDFDKVLNDPNEMLNDELEKLDKEYFNKHLCDDKSNSKKIKIIEILDFCKKNKLDVENVERIPESQLRQSYYKVNLKDCHKEIFIAIDGDNIDFSIDLEDFFKVKKIKKAWNKFYNKLDDERTR